ncbi:molybdate ABC transporter permease subunit [Granulicella tundricola]|uniref:Molybdenum transport system permease n=1 Tax=Granulicella tundricola (strain ATCC BAA-1859 / DSM 23138 / MP5ACTX9) TaxID=1198114 RepID=E8WZE4_GRATM|nr:molybdate ABC transporter permease subunit [Granulicella tundricola]ADW68832.1 molybdate ABC transporter, inner membrane subunit [Granulicella tundricola MP5ACTX9]
MDVGALILTLRLAGMTTLLLLIVAVPLAWWIARGRGFGRAGVQAIVSLPLVLPPTVLGFYLLVMLGPQTAIGRGIIDVIGHPLAFSFSGLLVGSCIYSLPFAVQPLVAGFRGLDGRYLEAAAGLGMSPWVSFRRVVLPMVSGSMLAAGVLAFSHTVGEFGVVLMLGGNLPGATRTLSIVLFDQVQDFNYAGANQTAAVLLCLSLAALIAVYAGRGRGGDVI